MKKRITALFLVALMTVSLIACTSEGGETSNPTPDVSDSVSPSQREQTPVEPPKDVEITIRLEQFSGSGASEDALKAMIDEFRLVYPNITVDLQTVGYDDYFTQLQTKVVGGNAADVFELNFENFVSYASEGVLLDISGMIGDTSGFNPTALNAFNFQGTQYGVPNSFSNVVLIYNKDLFDQAGIAYPSDSWTWAEMLDAAKTIRSLSSEIFGLYRPISFHEFYKGVRQNGGALLTDDMSSFTVNLPQNVETLETMIGWVNDSNVMPSDAQMGGMGDWDLFISGRLGMIVTGIWAFNHYTENCDFAWDIAIEPGNTNKASHFFSNAYVVNKDTAHPEASVALASFLAGSREAASIRVAASWELPPVTYTDILDAYLSISPPANRKAVFDSLNYLCTPPVVRQQAEMQDIIGKHLGNALSGSVSAQEALDACQQELVQKIDLSR